MLWCLFIFNSQKILEDKLLSCSVILHAYSQLYFSLSLKAERSHLSYNISERSEVKSIRQCAQHLAGA